MWLARQPAERFADRRVQTGLVVGDLTVITIAVALADESRGQFFLPYFLLLLVVSLSGSFQRVAMVTAGACVAYAVTLWASHDANDVWSPSLWVQVPLLFVTGSFFGLIAQTSRDEHEALVSSEHERRALETVLALTEQLDADLDAEAIVGTVSERLASIVPRARLLQALYQTNVGETPAQVVTITPSTVAAAAPMGSPTEALASVPMVRRGQVVGTFVVSADPVLTASELHGARILADTAANALANSQLYQRERASAERYQRLEAEHRRLFENAEDWIGVYRHDGTIEAWNHGAERISGVMRADAIGSRVDRFFAPGTDPSWFLRTLARGTVHTGVETVRVRADGSERFVVSTLSPIATDGGHEPRVLEIAKDLTEQRQLASRLDQAEKMSAMGNLISGVAHELNNPLTAVLLCARAIERNPTTSPERLTILVSEAQRASRIVADLLAYARPAHDEHTDVDPARVVERAVRAFHAARIGDAPDVRVDVPAGLGTLHGSSREIEQAILNLLRNASQAMRGQGQIRVLAYRPTGLEQICIEVEDEGPGVPAGIRARIFDPFFTTKAPGEGTGLGLSLVQRVMASHRGKVEVDDRVGGGAVFRLRFPSQPVSRAASFSIPDREIPLA
ncbi:MAG: PAS domain S-box protein [Deltaproteobacteria bacterium]|nr:PAS domain S-box protein [Deltaproteobacteria bacterium]